MEAMIAKTIKALKENQFDAYYAENSLEALEIVKGLIKEGERVDRGGSLTIEQTGILRYITEGNFGYADPYKETDPVKKAQLMQARLSCDTFFCSANAIITDYVFTMKTVPAAVLHHCCSDQSRLLLLLAETSW